MMELSLQAPAVVSWVPDHHRLWAAQTRFSSSQLGMLARKSERHSSIRCCASKGGGESVEEKQVPEATSFKDANGVDSGAWTQGERNSDPFFGWMSDGSERSTGNSAAGWMKIGGVIVLTLGFTLGARSLYLKRDAAREFTATPSATAGETARSFSKATGVEEMAHNLDLKKSSEASESNAEVSLEDAKQVESDKPVSDLQLEDGSEAPASENLEINSQMADQTSINDGAVTISVSDKSGDEGGVLETLAADEDKPAESKEHASAALEDEVSPGVTESAEFSDEDINPLFEGDSNLEGSDLSATSTGEDPTLEESLLHEDDDIMEESQRMTLIPDSSESLATEEPNEKTTSLQDEWGGGKPSIYVFASFKANKGFLPATITAPCTSSNTLPSSLGELIVPAQVDHMQEQILAALQALKVIEADVKPGDICTRREYARWLMTSSANLTRSPAHKVLPAMYMENVSVLAYDDVTPEDQDFSCIQGLAEAGLLSSRLVDHDQHGGEKDSNASVFFPNSPLTRQDLVTWKVALERKPTVADVTPTSTGLTALRDKFGFLDLDKIHEDAWPALLVDMSAGEQSIIALAFGYTRRLQPQKPVTKGQAAVALATGEAWELVSEELARLEAESVAEAAVVAEMALEAKAQKEVAAAFEKLIHVEREKQQALESMLVSTQAELQQMKVVLESEKFSLLRDRAAVDAEKELLSSARLEVEQQALALASAKLEVAFQREQADKLRAEAEEDRALISKIRSQLEIEKSALNLARSWAEDEARKAQEHSRVLEQARSRWESRGIQVNVDKELDAVDEEVNSFSPSWQYNEGAEAQETPADGLVKESSEEFQAQNQNSPADGLIKKSREFGRMLVDTFIRFLHFLQLIFHAIQKRAAVLIGKAGERFHEARMKCVDGTAKAVEGVKRTVPSSVTGLTSSLREGTLKTVEEWKGGAEKLSQKFKTP